MADVQLYSTKVSLATAWGKLGDVPLVLRFEPPLVGGTAPMLLGE